MKEMKPTLQASLGASLLLFVGAASLYIDDRIQQAGCDYICFPFVGIFVLLVSWVGSVWLGGFLLKRYGVFRPRRVAVTAGLLLAVPYLLLADTFILPDGAIFFVLVAVYPFTYLISHLLWNRGRPS